MPCDDLQISLFFDGEMEAAEAARFRVHLSKCADCKRAYQELLWLDGALNDKPARAAWRPPPQLWAASLLLGLLCWGLGHAPLPASQPTPERPAVVEIQGGELLEMAIGENTPDHFVNLEQVRSIQ